MLHALSFVALFVAGFEFRWPLEWIMFVPLAVLTVILAGRPRGGRRRLALGHG
jgi:membrane protein implicated in regulation of membrane protease activity